jgi:hypothetical protein
MMTGTGFLGESYIKILLAQMGEQSWQDVPETRTPCQDEKRNPDGYESLVASAKRLNNRRAATKYLNQMSDGKID